jgi:leucyl aminopeptidase
MPKTIQKTTVIATQSLLTQVKADMLVLGLFKNTKRLPEPLGALDRMAGQVISQLIKLGDFTGDSNQTALLYPQGKLPCRRILLVGLGDRKSLQLNTLRQAAGTAARQADKLAAPRLALALHAILDGKFEPQIIGQALAEGAIAGRYTFQEYLPTPKDKTRQISTLRVTVVDPKISIVRKLNAGCKIGTILGEAQNLTRSVDNRPGNDINPPSLAREAQKLARQFGLRCKVFDDKQLAKIKMNSILAVGGGSASKPRLIMLEYNGRRGSKKANNSPDAVIVGKAITFDSGGLSLKPSAGMETMIFDKSGGCNVLGILTGAAQLKLPLHIVGLIPAAENLPSHTSYRPGDIVRTYSGKTVMVDNTDAEGRLILCDALNYAAKMKPAAIIDMATLTGAVVIALGEHHAGLFSNNAALQRKLEQAADASGEAVWSMPSGPEYLEQMKSKVADLKNTGGREGGACTAAAFLGDFVENNPWAHIDIAAVADTDKEKPYRSIGATGFAVRLVLEYLRNV